MVKDKGVRMVDFVFVLNVFPCVIFGGDVHKEKWFFFLGISL